MSEKIYITISDKRGVGGLSTDGSNKNGGKDQDTESLFGSYVKHEVFNFVKQQAKKVVDYSLGNIGNFTGDYTTQRQVNTSLSALSQGLGIALSTKVGFKVGGVPGALIGFAIGVAATGITNALQDNTQKNENYRTNYQIAQLRERAGLNVYKDGSRGTEN